MVIDAFCNAADDLYLVNGLNSHAQVFLKCKDGTVITGSEHVYSLRDMMEALNLRFDDLPDSQKAAIKKLAQDYADVMTQWRIENMQ